MSHLIVVSSDWHADAVTLGVPRYEEVRDAVHESVQYAIDNNASAYIMLGDLADPDSGGATFRAVALQISTAFDLADEGIRSIWIAGNHCVHEDGSGATVMSPLAAVARDSSLIRVAEEPCITDIAEDLAVLCLPFTAVSRGVDLAKRVKELWPRDGTKVIVASHLTVPGIMPGEETHEMPRGREIAYPFAETSKAIVRIQGHYHQRQTFDPGDGGPPIIIPGSLARLTFGEQDHTPAFIALEV